MLDKKTLSKFGVGAWGLGGFAQHDPNNDDDSQINAVAYTLNKGINFIVINYWNSEGHSLEIISKAIKKSQIARKDLFYVQVIYDYNNPTIKDVEAEFEQCLEKFETNYIDSLEFSLTAIIKYGFENIVNLVQRYLREGKIRYTSVTNFNLDYLKRYYSVFGNKLFSHELCYNFEIRENETLGITEYGNKHGIINVLYQPLRRNRTANRNWPLLVKLASKYQKTQNQIILNWISSKGFHPLIKSEKIAHIDENISAFNFTIEPNDLERLNNFEVNKYITPKIDWFMTGDGTKIHALPNEFDDKYPYL